MEAAAEKSRSATLGDLQAWTYYTLYFILDYQVGEPTIQSARSPRAASVWSAFLKPFLPFVYGYPSSSPCAQCAPNKSVPTLCYTRRHGPIYTGPCPKALTECSPLDFRRSSINSLKGSKSIRNKVSTAQSCPHSFNFLSTLSITTIKSLKV